MTSKKPQFEITNAIWNEVTEIAELVGQVNATQGLSTNPVLCRTNRIRSICSSLAIKQALQEVCDKKLTKAEPRWSGIEQFLQENEMIANADVREMLAVSSATAKRILTGLAEAGKLEKIRVGRSWAYRRT